MTQDTTWPKTIIVDDNLVNVLKPAIAAALAYEEATKGRRKLGITGEVGELLACHQLGFKLTLNPRSEGFDAIDKDGLRVQIKTRRSESRGLPRGSSRTSRFSKHEFDYQLYEIWRADYEKLRPVIESQKRRNPSLSSFKRIAKRLHPKEPL